MIECEMAEAISNNDTDIALGYCLNSIQGFRQRGGGIRVLQLSTEVGISPPPLC